MNLTGGVHQWTKFLGSDETCLGKKGDYPGLPNRGATLINESGFYKLVLKSRKPEARKFQDWVTGVVLPAIRKDGGYILASKRPAYHHFVIGHTGRGEEVDDNREPLTPPPDCEPMEVRPCPRFINGGTTHKIEDIRTSPSEQLTHGATIERPQTNLRYGKPIGNPAMNALTNFTTAKTLTMSSREIAERTDKEHFNVMRDIRVLLDQLGEDAFSFEGMSQDAYGRPLKVFNLPKELTLTLVAGYSAPLRHRIVLRWLELEEAAKGPALPNFSNPAEAARAWALEFERAEEQARLVVEHAKKVEALEVDLEVAGRMADVVAKKPELLREHARCPLPGVNLSKLQEWLSYAGLDLLRVYSNPSQTP